MTINTICILYDTTSIQNYHYYFNSKPSFYVDNTFKSRNNTKQVNLSIVQDLNSHKQIQPHPFSCDVIQLI